MTKKTRTVAVTNKNRSTSFTPVIEDLLPKTKGISSDVLDSIFIYVDKLKTGQSFFVPKTVISSTSLRNQLKEYVKANKPFFKDWDLRVTVNASDKVQGCRIARFN